LNRLVEFLHLLERLWSDLDACSHELFIRSN
jgi:hypothetical protein